MNNYSWKKHYAIKQKFEETIGKNIPEKSGIYLWTRVDNAIKKTYFYVGQAKSLKNRRFDYYKIQTGLAYPTRHFEASLKAHNDWKYQIIEECEESKLDEREKYWITYYMCQDNFITRNDSLTGNDTTKTNAHRIGRIKKEYEEAIQKCIKNLDVKYENTILIFEVKKNKDGTLNKRSEDAMKNLIKILGVKNEI